MVTQPGTLSTGATRSVVKAGKQTIFL